MTRSDDKRQDLIHLATLAAESAARQATDVVVDASWSDGIAGLAYVSPTLGIRTVARWCPGCNEAEAEAVLLAMHDARAETASRLTIATDSLIAALTEPPTSRAPASLHACLTEIRELLTDMPDWQLIHTPKSETLAAHTLARKAMRDCLRRALKLGIEPRLLIPSASGEGAPAPGPFNGLSHTSSTRSKDDL
jgi:Reverse transcriptase-like